MCEPIIADGSWVLTKLATLHSGDVITLLGREMAVEMVCPSRVGGDFWTLEAYGLHRDPLVDILALTLDKNTEVYCKG